MAQPTAMHHEWVKDFTNGAIDPQSSVTNNAVVAASKLPGAPAFHPAVFS